MQNDGSAGEVSGAAGFLEFKGKLRGLGRPNLRQRAL